MEVKEEADLRNRAMEQAKMREEMERLVAKANGGQQKGMSPNPSISDPPTWSRDMVCYKCHRPGHISRYCPNRKDGPRPASPTQNLAAQAPPAAACPPPLVTCYNQSPVIASRSLSGALAEIISMLWSTGLSNLVSWTPDAKELYFQGRPSLPEISNQPVNA